MKKCISLSVLLSLGAMSLLTGCGAKPAPLYNYEGYSQNYYNYKKTPSPESLEKLIEVMEEDAANTNDSRAKRVPPGLYANLGYLYLKSNDKKKAVIFFEKEKSIYPESSKFMDKLIKKVEVSQGDAK